MSDEWFDKYLEKRLSENKDFDPFTRARRDQMRRALSTPEGKAVLSFLLDTLGLFRPAADETDRVLRNYAVFFMSHGLGVLSPENHDSIVNALLAIQPYEHEPRDNA